MIPAPITAIIVVVPVHDEEELLARCLGAVTDAVAEASASGVRCEVRIVLDACTDRSDEVAAGAALPMLRTSGAVVGAARAAGITDALSTLDAVPASRIWIANTNGDSAVPPTWLTAQRAAADAGADVYLGTVRPDFAEVSARYAAHWRRTHPPGRPAGNVHGASLGIRASTYLAAGGFGSVAEHEDVQLVERARAAGGRIVASDAAEVLTSGRTVGRTPGGYAAFVRRQESLLARE